MKLKLNIMVTIILASLSLLLAVGVLVSSFRLGKKLKEIDKMVKELEEELNL